MTTTSDVLAAAPSEAFVWVWLPGSSDPVVAGRIRVVAGGGHQFIYGRTYLQRSDAVSLYGPELPLRAGWIEPLDGLAMAGCLWDASPDSWGQRVINVRLAGGRFGDAADLDLPKLTYLLESGSDRIGAMDFQRSSEVYVSRIDDASLDEMHSAAQAVERGDLSAALSDAFVNATAVGGARPKVLVRDGRSSWIAKLSMSSDLYPVVKAEAAAMALARRVGIDVPDTRVTSSLDRDVLLVRRFDRPGGSRRMMVSALTMLGFGDFLGARYSSYVDLLAVLRRSGSDGADAGRTLFERIVFNVAVSNFDDHARNHAAFWDGSELELTPAYDLCPQLRTPDSLARQAMDITPTGVRDSRFAVCLDAASAYGLSPEDARAVIDRQVATINESWPDVVDEVGLSRADRTLLWKRQILNKFAFEGYV